ncbi:MAG: Outer membrane protein P6 precursor [Syntrophorhabdaceae bacterium PtaU1.Bin034]|jgi:peptidoglycan-associated lipoprotein|nr:MAG: Outer membrane protein P6 precursor [Syntrophorhabdaceae bacterium PtaU1.Bin034]
MKMKSIGLLLLVVALTLSLAGCGCFQQKMKGEAAPPKAPEKMVAPEEKKEVIVKKEEAAPAVAAPAAVAAALQDIYFDFDRYNIRPADAEILKKNYEWFKSNSGKVRIEGNCDERGTVEYNLALGQKRADAAKAYLVNLGADSNRMETVSYGKEKPVDPGHNEAAWAKNRRVHFTPLQ